MPMRRSFHLATMIGVAAVLLSVAAASAQVPKIEGRMEKVQTTITGKMKVGAPGGMRIRNVPGPVAPMPEKAQIEAMAEQFVRQVRPIVRAELHLIRTVCKTSKEDQIKLSQEGGKVLKEVAGKVAESQFKMLQGIANPTFFSTPTEVQKAMAAAVKTILTPEQSARYQAEIDTRARAERAIIARALVAKFDRILNLSPDQRTKITASIAKSDSPTAKSMNNIMYNNEYIPAIPDADVVGFLDAQQKTIWQGAERVHYSSFSFGISGVNLSDDDFAEEDDPAAVKQAARRKAADGAIGILGNGMMRMMVPGAPRIFAPPPAAVPAPQVVAPVVEGRVRNATKK